MIQVKNLTRRFGGAVAIDNISFDVGSGEIVGFLGPNGAGKTTTMRILSCFLWPTGGNVAVAGFDVFQNSLEVRRRIGYLPENVPLYTELRVKEYLRFRARLKGLRGRTVRARVDEVIASCGLDGEQNAVIGRLSKGYRQRVGLADSMVHDPAVLILDEPTGGLDPNQRRHMRTLIKGLAPRHTVVLSSHILAEIEMVCDRVLIMNKGQIVASDTPEKLVGLIHGNPRVIAEIRGPQEQILKRLKEEPGIAGVTCEPVGDNVARFVCECDKGADVRAAVFSAAASNNWLLLELRVEKGSLEDVFAEITKK